MGVRLAGLWCDPLYIAKEHLRAKRNETTIITYHPCTNGTDTNGEFDELAELASYLVSQGITVNDMKTGEIRSFPYRQQLNPDFKEWFRLPLSDQEFAQFYQLLALCSS